MRKLVLVISFLFFTNVVFGQSSKQNDWIFVSEFMGLTSNQLQSKLPRGSNIERSKNGILVRGYPAEYAASEFTIDPQGGVTKWAIAYKVGNSITTQNFYESNLNLFTAEFGNPIGSGSRKMFVGSSKLPEKIFAVSIEITNQDIVLIQWLGSSLN
jgi:hypothetical protein